MLGGNKMKYRISVGISRVIEANDEEEAGNKFWEELEKENGIENTSITTILNDSMKIKKTLK